MLYKNSKAKKLNRFGMQLEQIQTEDEALGKTNG